MDFHTHIVANNSNLRWKLSLALLAMITALAGLLLLLLLGDHSSNRSVHSLRTGMTKFNLSDSPPLCSRWKDHMPAKRGPAAYRLYMEARKLWRSKIGWQLTHAEATRILADVSKAAEMGDWGARSLMAHFYLHGLGVLDSNHVLDPAPEKAVALARMAAEAGQPWGLFDLGVAYEHGYGGVPYDIELAWAYYRRAAEFGSPEAQMALAEAYTSAGRREDRVTMLRCAYQQGHGPAAYALALTAGVKKRYQEAINLYQEGVKFGSIDCARDLEVMFSRGYWGRGSEKEKEILQSLGVEVDPERQQRYIAIYDALQINPDLKLSRLDLVLPLPPAKLPRWSGVSAAVEAESNSPPTY